MATTYIQLAQQIEVLKAEAEKVKRLEIAGVVEGIKKAIEVYGLTAEELGFGKQTKASAKSPTVKSPAGKARGARKMAGKRKAAVSYRDTQGNQWSGMGPRPGWLKAALAAGQSLESLAVSAVGVESAAVSSGETVKPVKSKGRARKLPSAAKYKDDAGHTWSGRGPRPAWLKQALAAGRTLESLAA